jgi:DNA mismatch repair protein MutL
MQQVFHLKGTQKQRIVQILGSNYNAKLVSVGKTDYMNIYGLWETESAKKTRGDLFCEQPFH